MYVTRWLSALADALVKELEQFEEASHTKNVFHVLFVSSFSYVLTFLHNYISTFFIVKTPKFSTKNN